MLSRRSSSRLTLAWCHLPPSAVGMSRLFNACAMALNETRPFAWSRARSRGDARLHQFMCSLDFGLHLGPGKLQPVPI
jgi:hypothetical protein